jgi:hypothetical protein
MGKYADLVKHGHTHGPGGTDPVPGLTLTRGGMVRTVKHHQRFPLQANAEPMQWPGGVQVVPLWSYRTSGTEVQDTAQSQGMSYKQIEVSADGTASSPATECASVSCADLTGLLAGEYIAFVGFRISNDPSRIWGVKIDQAGNSPAIKRLSGNVQDYRYYGLARVGSIPIVDVGGTLSIKAVGEGGTSGNEIWLDTLYLFPAHAGTSPDTGNVLDSSVPFGLNAGVGGALWNYEDGMAGSWWNDYLISNNPTVTTVGRGANIPFGIASLYDAFYSEQEVDSIFDPDFRVNAWEIGFGDSYGSYLREGGGASGDYNTSFDIGYPRHVYVMARYSDPAGGETYGEGFRGAHVTLFDGGVPVGDAMPVSRSWQFLYLGLVSDIANEIAVAAWMQNPAAPEDCPFVATDFPTGSRCHVGAIGFVSSWYDQAAVA